MKIRRILVTSALVAAAIAAGWLLRGSVAPESPGPSAGATEDDSVERCPDGSVPRLWRAPMDPNFVRDRPGKSPMGMDLVPVCESGGEDEPGAVRIDPAIVQSTGVRTAEVVRGDLSRTIRAVGRVDWDERRVAHVHTKVQGWVETLHVGYVGQTVKRGEPLLEIYSPELVSTQEELLVAARYRDSTAASEFGDVAEGGESLFEATRRRLELWDISDRDIDHLLETGEVRRTLTLRAPTRGVVTRLEVRSGMEVAPNTNLYTIADPSVVWVMADVYENELPWIEVGQEARVELASLPGESFSGPITYVSPFLDTATRTAEVRIELPNPDGRLRPGMFGNVFVEGTPRRDVVIAPTEAIIRSGRRTVAIVALGEGRFVPREVETGIASGNGRTEIVSGLSAGERVVVSSQFLIDSESRLQEVLEKLMGAGEPEDDASGDPHAGHDMGAASSDPHAGHDMGGANDDPHAGHDMGGANDDPHAGHDMGGANDDPHAGHDMGGASDDPHAGHDIGRD